MAFAVPALPYPILGAFDLRVNSRRTRKAVASNAPHSRQSRDRADLVGNCPFSRQTLIRLWAWSIGRGELRTSLHSTVDDFVAEKAQGLNNAQQYSIDGRKRFNRNHLEPARNREFQSSRESVLQAGGHRFDPGHVHQYFQRLERRPHPSLTARRMRHPLESAPSRQRALR